MFPPVFAYSRGGGRILVQVILSGGATLVRVNMSSWRGYPGPGHPVGGEGGYPRPGHTVLVEIGGVPWSRSSYPGGGGTLVQVILSREGVPWFR